MLKGSVDFHSVYVLIYSQGIQLGNISHNAGTGTDPQDRYTGKFRSWLIQGGSKDAKILAQCFCSEAPLLGNRRQHSCLGRRFLCLLTILTILTYEG